MQYAIRRILINIPVLFAVTIIIYALINLAPGDPLDFFTNEVTILSNLFFLLIFHLSE